MLASLALGTAIGYVAHSRESLFILGVLPHGFMVGLPKQSEAGRRGQARAD
jgi:hypothetical protein